MTSIRKRPDRPKPWLARYTAPDGRRHSRSFTRKVDAERWLATQNADVARGAWVDPALGRVTFAEWVPRWEAGLHGVRASTRELNTRVARKHLLPRFGATPLARISPTEVKAMLADDLAAGYSASAARRHVLVLSTILGAAVDEGYIAANPCRKVKLPPEAARDMRFLTARQALELADAIRPRHYRALVMTAAFVGLRFGELAGLGIEHVDPLRRTLRVERQLVELPGSLDFGPPKTKAGVRTVTMPKRIAELLGEHMGTAPVRTSGLVFPSSEGTPLRRASLGRVWRRAVDECFAGTDLEGLVFHELRHTAASLAIASSAHPLVVRDRLGHSSITVTYDTYGHLFPSQDVAVAEALDDLLREAEEDRGGPPLLTMSHPGGTMTSSGFDA